MVCLHDFLYLAEHDTSEYQLEGLGRVQPSPSNLPGEEVMKRFTLDTNCLIDLENEAPSAEYIRKLYRYHTTGKIRLYLPAVAASEQPRKGREIKTFDCFIKRISDAGIPDVELLRPYMFMNLSFLDYSMLTDDHMMKLDRDIHQILFPRLPYRYGEYCSMREQNPEKLPIERKWRNAKCDVMIAWCHIFHHGDVLVTRDGNFLKATKKPRLLALGAGEIVFPEAAAGSFTN